MLMGGAIAAHYQDAVSVYAAEVLSDTPQMYYRLGEASGTTAVDSSGNGRNGTYVNTPGLGATSLLPKELTNTGMGVTSNAGTCASLASAAWMNQTVITVECLARLTSTFDSGNGDAIVSRYGAGGFNWLLWRTTGGAWAVQARNTSGTVYNVAQVGSVALSTTYHLAFTWGGGFLTLYVNGVQVGQTAVTGNLQTGTEPIEVGRYSGSAGTTPGGTIDEVSVYPTALAATRIAAHWLAAAGAPVHQSSTWTAAFGTAVNATKPTGLAVGDLMYAQYACNAASTMGVPSGWTKAMTDTGQSGVAWRIATAGDVAASTFPFTSSNGLGTFGVILNRITGHDPTNPIDVVNNTLTTAANPVSPTLTATNSASLLLGACIAPASTTAAITVPTGMAAVQNALTPSMSRAVAVQPVASGATGTRTWTAVSTTYAHSLVVIKGR